MELITVLAAAAAAWLLGAVWYTLMARHWVAASGVATDDAGRPANAGSTLPYLVSLLSVVLVSGMMRHIFTLSGIETLSEGVTAGAALGAFVAMPWLATCYGFAGRPWLLTAIDGAYAVLGCAIMGLVLTLL